MHDPGIIDSHIKLIPKVCKEIIAKEGGYNRCLLASKIIKLFINLMCESIVPGSCTVFQV